jgi:ABC-2 type transport system ATP-binding protein
MIATQRLEEPMLAMRLPAALAAGPAPTVRVDSLHKYYGAVHALSGISFSAGAGEILGVLGPNGAGKTTLIEILEGLRTPDAGTAEVLGCDVRDRAALQQNRHRIGIAMQRTDLPQRLTVEELLRIYAAFYPRPMAPAPLIERLGLADKRRARAATLSGGQLQRLAVGLALVGDPELLFLDEPTSQLDPQSRRAVWDLLLDEAARTRRTVLVNTHQMEEAEQLCTRVAIFDHGRILAFGTPAELVERHCPGSVLRFVTRGRPPLEFLGVPVEERCVSPERLAVTVRTDAVEETMVRLLAARAAGRLVVEELRLDRRTLEDVFLALTGREIRN